MYTYTRPTTPPLVTFQQMQSQLRITTTDEQDYINDLIDAATEYAETALSASLLQRPITAVFGEGYNPPLFGIQFPVIRNHFVLPRGPVTGFNSIVDGTGTNVTDFTPTRHGPIDGVTINQQFTFPLTIVYVAGYGTNVTDVPADIRMAIRTHVASLWRVRSSIEDGGLAAVPHSLEAFYAGKRRQVCVV